MTVQQGGEAGRPQTVMSCLRRGNTLCIYQDDMAERNEQVRMMGHIYAGAAVVSAWLGVIPLPACLNYEGRIVTLEVDDFDWEGSMEEIARRPYWTRSWIIQEFLLAKEVHIYYSNVRVDDQFFRDLLARAADMDLIAADIADLVQKPDLMRRWLALPLVIERHYDRYPDLHQLLYDLLAGHAYAESTDPRDKVFALLGLLPSEERLLLERRFPDYTLSTEQVNVVTLAHLTFFAGDRPCEPVFKALRIDKCKEIGRLLRVVENLDYIGAENPAVAAQGINAYFGRADQRKRKRCAANGLLPPKRQRRIRANMNGMAPRRGKR